jgi:hypothetical protein
MVDTKNFDWKVMPLPDGTFPNDQITHCLLMDIRRALQTIKRIAIFSTTMFVVSAILGLLIAVAR